MVMMVLSTTPGRRKGKDLLDVVAVPRYRAPLGWQPCFLDLFLAEPRALALQGADGNIEALYRENGAWEPVEKKLVIQSGKLLCRKVAAIKHAVHAAPDGVVVVWTDMDVRFQKPLNGAFAAFVREFDVTYCPFLGREMMRGLDDPFWRIESGVFIIVANARTRALTAAALELYDGGILAITRACEARGVTEPECAEPWLFRNLFLNDIYVWALLLHGAHRDSKLLREFVPSFPGFVF